MFLLTKASTWSVGDWPRLQMWAASFLSACLPPRPLYWQLPWIIHVIGIVGRNNIFILKQAWVDYKVRCKIHINFFMLEKALERHFLSVAWGHALNSQREYFSEDVWEVLLWPFGATKSRPHGVNCGGPVLQESGRLLHSTPEWEAACLLVLWAGKPVGIFFTTGQPQREMVLCHKTWPQTSPVCTAKHKLLINCLCAFCILVSPKLTLKGQAHIKKAPRLSPSPWHSRFNHFTADTM